MNIQKQFDTVTGALNIFDDNITQMIPPVALK